MLPLENEEAEKRVKSSGSDDEKKRVLENTKKPHKQNMLKE